MPRWKELPETTDDRSRQLVRQLRKLKDDTGLSLSSLAVRTTYSRSSWERYLNGRQLPPPEAVRELARAAGTAPERLLALREVAAVARAEEPPAAGPRLESPAEAEPALPERRRSTRVRLAVGGAAGLAVLAGGGALIASAPWEKTRSPLVSAHEAGPYVWDSTGKKKYDCEIQRYRGRTYAGHSATRTTVLEHNSTEWAVVEVQCLLLHAGFDPGDVDGVYGESTERAVKRLQSAADIADDGAVGPETWGVLRR